MPFSPAHPNAPNLCPDPIPVNRKKPDEIWPRSSRTMGWEADSFPQKLSQSSAEPKCPIRHLTDVSSANAPFSLMAT